MSDTQVTPGGILPVPAIAETTDVGKLLSPPAPENLSEAELRRRRIDELFAIADQLATQDTPAMSPAEIEAEIEASRLERRRHPRGD